MPFVAHSHLLTLSYSFMDQQYDSRCRACRMEFYNEYWLYKCSKCMFYVHIGCATNDGRETWHARDFTFRLPGVLNFPLDDGSDILDFKIPSGEADQRLEEIRDENGHFKHSIHEHPLVLIHTKNNNDTATTSTLQNKSRLSLHNPIERVKLLCNGCLSPITTTPFYMCSQAHERSNFVLHERCTRLPIKLEDHPHHPQHALVLLPNQSLFSCRICRLPCNGFAYNCSTCENYKIDVKCGFIPKAIRHEAYPRLLLQRNVSSQRRACFACRNTFNTGDIVYTNVDDIFLDVRCALHLPKTIRHKCDKHTLKLSYSPIQDHKGQYFCEICEEDLNPEKWFYHCVQCGQSIHSDCAPLILKSEQGVNSFNAGSVYKFLNVKFGGVRNVKDHMHPVSFVAGTKSDGDCTKCRLELQSKFILKCLRCEFAIHSYCESSVTEPMKQEVVSMFDDLERRHEREKKIQHESVVSFYPRGNMRPTTRSWTFL